MKCAEAKRLFSPTLDSMLDCAAVLGLERHMAECERCAAEFAGLRHTKWLLGTIASHPTPADLELRLNAALAAIGTGHNAGGYVFWGGRTH